MKEAGAQKSTGARLRRIARALVFAALAVALATCWADPARLRQAFTEQVDRRLEPPPEEAQRYGHLARDELQRAGIAEEPSQYALLVDRSASVQAIFVFWLPAGAAPVLVGAAPVSTGRPGGFEYFETPLGVFEHSVTNHDFRAEGSRNEFGIRGYGEKGMRVFDFGWQQARRLWGRGGTSTMRLQMHATDPDRLEPRLGSVQSKGCIRIPASLNRFLDRLGVLDADYLRAKAEGSAPWVLPPDQAPAEGAGRYLIVVDSGRSERPAWSPPPKPGTPPAGADSAP
ncbi:L,D-transpeptidase [Variovorax sp. V59]|uniref:L,D-transpeptidase n=1 Tax=unclassified Variovorax TaxID=663243 RepID=UPI0034E96141